MTGDEVILACPIVPQGTSKAGAGTTRHAPRLSLDRTLLVGCICGWPRSPDTAASAAALAWHVARAGAVSLELLRRDGRIAAVEVIGCAISTLNRLDHAWCDEDVREILTQVRATLSIAQSKTRERIDE